MSRDGRRLLVPEVVQASGMDCGPAALACLLGGFGVHVGYGRLREACQTDVDGTSIDALEDAANLLGLDAEQVMMPVERVLLDETAALAALVVIRLPSGLTHFVVAWRRHRRFVQIMDPAVGRRWIRADRFLSDIYVHRFVVPEEAFAEWATSDELARPLRRGLSDLGVDADLVEPVAAESGWRGLAALDAATRLGTSLVAAGALRPGQEAAALVERLSAPDGSAAIPEASWFARPGGEDGGVSIRGAVLLRVRGVAEEPPAVADLPPDLRAAVEEPRPRPADLLVKLLRHVGGLRRLMVAAAAALAGVGVVVEALLFRGVSVSQAASGDARTARIVLLVAVAAALLVLEASLAAAGLRLGRALEAHLRGSLLRRLPRMPDRYFRSRPVADPSERAHRLHQLRQLPVLGAELVRAASEVIAFAVAIAVVDPSSAVPAVLAAAAATGAALLMQPTLAERDFRLRNHSGAAARFYLDGLLGLVPLRAHSAEPVVETEHGRLVGEWVRAARAAARTVVSAEAVQAVLGVGLAVWLVVGVRDRAAEPATFLLLAFWALSLPVLGQRIGVLARQYPLYRNTTLRFLEPLSSPEEPEPPPTAAAADATAGVEVRLAGVRVVAGGSSSTASTSTCRPGAGWGVRVVGSGQVQPGGVAPGLARTGRRPGAGRRARWTIVRGWRHSRQ